MNLNLATAIQEQGSTIQQQQWQALMQVAAQIRSASGRMLLVGGAVRDLLLRRLPHDYDIEVYGINAQKLEDLLKKFGTVDLVGKSFGVFKLQLGGATIDVALPRTEEKIGQGHRGFAVQTAPLLTPQKALARRDFTINAMAWDPLSQELIDPYGGQTDLHKKVLRATHPTHFGEDPLRAVRALQLIARFGLYPHKETAQMLHGLRKQIQELPAERLWPEWEKLFLAPHPAIALAIGMQLQLFEVLHPELPPLQATPQPKQFHPEGNVWNHTLLTVQWAVTVADREKLSSSERLTVALASFCHDLGKPHVTTTHNGRIHSYGHAEAGVAPTNTFLTRIGASKKMTRTITELVRLHMRPRELYRKRTTITNRPVYDLARTITPATIKLLCHTCEADLFGRGAFPGGTVPDGEAPLWLAHKAQSLDIFTQPPQPILDGADLFTRGFTESKLMGDVINAATRLHEENDLSKEEIIHIINAAGRPSDVLKALTAAAKPRQ